MPAASNYKIIYDHFQQENVELLFGLPFIKD